MGSAGGEDEEERLPVKRKFRRFVSPEWCASHKTDSAVAVAIHAIADASRTPEQIWEAPTRKKWNV
jgi:hypothetical protein